MSYILNQNEKERAVKLIRRINNNAGFGSIYSQLAEMDNADLIILCRYFECSITKLHSKFRRDLNRNKKHYKKIKELENAEKKESENAEKIEN